MFVTLAGNIAAKGGPILGCAKAEAMEPTGEERAVAGEQVDIIAFRAESEVGAADIEVGLIEGNKSARSKAGRGRNDELLGGVKAIAKEPTRDIHIGGRQVLDFNGVDLREIGVGERFADDDE